MNKFQPVGESTPHRSVKQLVVIRCRKDDALLSQRVEILHEAVDDTLELAEFERVPSKFCDGVELVEEQNARRLRRKFKKGPDILRGAAKKGRDQAVEPRDVKLEPQLSRNKSSETTFPVPGGPYISSDMAARTPCASICPWLLATLMNSRTVAHCVSLRTTGGSSIVCGLIRSISGKRLSESTGSVWAELVPAGRS